MKKISAFLLALSLALTLCACSPSGKIPSLEEIVENGEEKAMGSNLSKKMIDEFLNFGDELIQMKNIDSPIEFVPPYLGNISAEKEWEDSPEETYKKFLNTKSYADFVHEDFQCIKEEVTLDMQATNISEHQETILTDSDGESFLPVAVIYGPNGGGKTTVLKALYALACKIMRPICAVSCDNEDCIKSSEHISIEPYAFSKDTIKAPTEFELFFRTKTYEYQYQVSIRKDMYKNAIHVEVHGLGVATLRVVYAAKKYVLDNELKDAEIWCVYDKDSFPNQDFNAVSAYVTTLNQKQSEVQYHVAWSNQCIEYWFILHFDWYVSDNDRKYYRVYLHKKFATFGYQRYEKDNSELFKVLTENGDPKKAIQRAQKRILECAGYTDSNSVPATKVHLLVSELARYLPDNLKVKYL